MEANREYKDGIIRTLFKSTKKALQLYKDISGKTFSENAHIEMKTIETVLLSKLRNDLAFIIDRVLVVIIEHQSTLSMNMPLRMLQYILVFYELYYKLGTALYKEKLLKLPKPEFYMLYNGKAPYPAKGMLRLSDAFEGLLEGEKPSLELIVTVININYGSHSDVLEKNKDLMEYALFVSKVRSRQQNGLKLTEAVRQSVKECIAKGILQAFLQEYENEVESMFSLFYNDDLAIKYAREEAWEDGHMEGHMEGREIGVDITTTIIGELFEHKPVKEIAARHDVPEAIIKEIQSVLTKYTV